MTPTEVLNAIGDLHSRLDDKRFAANITYMAAYHAGHMDVVRENIRQEALRRFSGAPGMFRRHLEVGDPYRVTHDMSLMVEWMASQLDGTDQVMRALAPSEAGVVCFDKPLRVTDIRGEQMLIHWMVWGPGEFTTKTDRRPEAATMMWLFNDTWRDRDQVQTLLQEEYLADTTYGDTPEERRANWDRYQQVQGRWATIGSSVLHDGLRVGEPMWTPSPEQALSVLEEGYTPVQGTNTVRFILALWMLLGQKITRVEDDTPDRPSRRRALRKGLPAKVTVIKLRREDKPTLAEGESEVQWSHRWMVKRHPRWQPYGHRSCAHEAGHHYGPVEVKIEHRGHGKVLIKRCVHCQDAYVARIFIEAYEKGPEGAPLIVSDKVYELSR